MMRKNSFLLVLGLLFSISVNGQSLIGTPFRKVGKLKIRSAKEIESSRWSIGGETLDRDSADYNAYKTFLDHLGAKRIRLQGGWAKSEQEKGIYDFRWLDDIIKDAKSRGVEPWVQFSYGNPIYEGGGQAMLAGGIPTSEEALEAWDNWVIAMVRHYKEDVKEWEIWNEPDLGDKFSAAEFAKFYERTADLVKKEQPDSRLIALGMASVSNIGYVETLLEYLKSQGKLDYVDAVSYHGYTFRPEDNYPEFVKLRKSVKSYNSEIELWQGENGAPSTPVGQAVGALTKKDWSELTQAKWNLRRMLGDMAYEVDVTNVFQISDMYYSSTDHLKGLNSKGLLKARPDKTIERPKTAYYAYQNVATVFSGKVEKIKDAEVNTSDKDLAIYAYRKENLKGTAITVWSAEARPVENFPAKKIDFTISGVHFTTPVLLDLLSGEVYSIPNDNYKKENESWKFTNIPVTDSPVVLVDSSWISYQ